MIREHVFTDKSKRDGGFRWRSREPSRLEGFSDAVFAFAVTLLVVSLEVPKTYDELVVTMQGFIGFGVTFALLVLIWHAQYTWFRRYGLDDAITTIVTMVLLFVVLFFVYPLKFFTAFTIGIIRTGAFPTTLLPDGRTVPMVDGLDQFLGIAAIYSAGYATIFALFALMYWHAYRKRVDLELSASELIETKFSFIEHSMHVAVGLLAVMLALVFRTYLAMYAFFLIIPLQTIQGRMRRKAREHLLRASDAGRPASDTTMPLTPDA